MKSFLKQVLAVIVGLTIFQIIAFIITIVFIVALVGSVKSLDESSFSGNQKVEVKQNSVLWMDLAFDISERNAMQQFDFTDVSGIPTENLGLQNIIKSIQYAKNDEKIKGIYMDLSFLTAGYASVDAIRRTLEDFKESGKFVIGYGEVITQKAYYLASVADKVYVNPKGFIELRGIGTRLTFFNKLLSEKLNADVQVFKVGTFKSAIEPFIRDDISEANREQLEFLLGGIKEDFISNISTSRNIPENDFNQILNDLKVRSAEDAVNNNIADAAIYYDEVLDILVEKTDADDYESLETISLAKYSKSITEDKKITKNKVAVVYAEGSIVDGNGQLDNIGSKKFAKVFRDIRTDDDVKAVVLRINSPGGSALASEVMWRELELLKGEKPLVVSMGDVAASGGYYIACNAHKIFAEENTVTGSIGVFGLIPNLEKFFDEKLGITFDDVKLNDHATFDGVTKGLDEYEAMVIQKGVNDVYESFTGRVAEGRDMDIEAVKKVAEGRVWTGEQAKEIGLVDELGDLQDALSHALSLAELEEEYRIVDYPKIKSPFEAFFQSFSGVKSSLLKIFIGEDYKYIEQINELKEMQNGVQAKMPYILEIN